MRPEPVTAELDAAGRLVYVKESAVSGTSGGVRESRHYYDSSGRLRASQDSGGARTYFFYDAEGQLSGQVDETGAVTEFTRDALGRITATTRYATRVNPALWSDGGDGEIDPPGTGPGTPPGGSALMRYKPEHWEFSAFAPGVSLGGSFIYDRIETAQDHRRKGLGAAVMIALASARKSLATPQLLVATEDGRGLYANLGWTVLAPFAAATIPES